jgi:hypothetical protein
MSGPLARWLRLPQVLADPEQVHDGRVWTRARDVLPGTVVREGSPLVAVWGDAVFEALPEWDEEELDSLWLRKIADVTLPRVTDVRGPGGGAEPEAGADVALSDLTECVTLLLTDRHQLRDWIRAFVDDVRALPPPASKAVGRLPSWHRLLQLSHLPAAPTATTDGTAVG